MLPLWVEKLDDVEDEGARKHYKPGADGRGFVLDGGAAGGFSIDKVAPIKSALASERARAQAAEDELAKFVGDDGNRVDPQIAKDAIKTVKSLGEGGDAKKMIEAGIAQGIAEYKAKHAKELGEKDKEIGELGSSLEDLLVVGALRAALTDTTGDRTAPLGDPAPLIAALRPAVKVVRGQDGRRIAKVIDPATGKPRITSKQGSDADMDVAEYVDEARNGAYKPYFKAREVKGSDPDPRRAQPRQPVGGGNGQPAQLSPTERLAAAHAAESGKR